MQFILRYRVCQALLCNTTRVCATAHATQESFDSPHGRPTRPDVARLKQRLGRMIGIDELWSEMNLARVTFTDEKNAEAALGRIDDIENVFSKRRCFKKPDSLFKQRWDLVQMLLLLYTAIVVPFNISFKPCASSALLCACAIVPARGSSGVCAAQQPAEPHPIRERGPCSPARFVLVIVPCLQVHGPLMGSPAELALVLPGRLRRLVLHSGPRAQLPNRARPTSEPHSVLTPHVPTNWRKSLFRDGTGPICYECRCWCRYVDEDDLVVTDLRKVAKHYTGFPWFNGWFTVDFMSCLPFNYITLVVDSFGDPVGLNDKGGAGSLKEFKLTKIVRLFRLAKMLRILRLKRLVEHYRKHVYAIPALMTIMQIGKAVVPLLYLAWWLLGMSARAVEGLFPRL